MKRAAVLNNYQMGDYAYRCLCTKIISEVRIDRYHTIIVWGDLTPSERGLLSKVVWQLYDATSFVALPYKGKWYNMYTGVIVG